MAVDRHKRGARFEKDIAAAMVDGRNLDGGGGKRREGYRRCLLYTSDAADE